MSNSTTRYSPLAALGSGFLEVAQITGALGVLFAQVLLRLCRLDFDRNELLLAMHKMGVKSAPVIFVTSVFVGAIMVVQAAPLITEYGAEGLLGWAAGFNTLREVGPLLTALMLSGRIGANNTAELGTMVVTEQIDVLRALAIDPLSYLVVPRFIAIIFTLFISTIFADLLALLGAAMCGWALVGVEPMSFYNGVTAGFIDFGDVMHGLIKSVFFGLIIALSSCHFGTTTSGGAPGVGRSGNATVGVTAGGIFAFDYIVSFALG